MNQKDLSTGIAFVRKEKAHQQPALFGDLTHLENLSIEPETTGVAMQVEDLVNKNIATKKDFRVLERSASGQDNNIAPEATLGQPEAAGRRADNRHEGSASLVIDPPPQPPRSVIHPEVQIGASDFLPVWFLETGVARSRTVCKIETSGLDYQCNSGVWRGTGFLISNNLLITNHHVLNSKAVCDNALCIFNYQTDESGKMKQTQTYQLKPERLFLTSPVDQLDFTICWVEGQPGREMGYFPIYRHAFSIKNSDCANIIQHPRGEPKAVVVQKNEVYDQDESVLHYTSDTLSGSSGSCVCNNAWRLIALHHASKELAPADLSPDNPKPARYINEGIKLSAIATYLEGLSSEASERTAANEVLSLFKGTDALMGYFGALGRIPTSVGAESALERVVDSYRGEAKDVDIGFWNIEWFNKFYTSKLERVAQIILQMNLDVWAFEESSPQATRALVENLSSQYQADYGFAASEPDAPAGKQSTTLIWNRKTVECQPIQWPEKIDRWFGLDSTAFQDASDLVLESNSSSLTLEKVDGKIFDRYPGLFKVSTVNRGAGKEVDFFVVPLHLKAMGEGSKRRALASRILAVAVQTMITEFQADADWILGGDLNATLASGDLSNLSRGQLKAISASDEAEGAFTYVKQPHRSLIDHIFLSPNLSQLVDEEDYFIVAKDRTLPDYLSVSDHRPVLVRLSLKETAEETPGRPSNPLDGEELIDILRRHNPRSREPRSPVEEPGTAREAIDRLRDNRERTYYDEVADSQARNGYYGKLPKGLDAGQLFNHFSELLTRTHKRVLPYQPANYLYPWVDLQPDKQSLRNIYSGVETSPETLIEADFLAESQRSEQMRRLESERGIGLGMESEQLLERLEAAFPFNCEHVVPQSWFGKAFPMKSDLHHLFACQPRCNSFRSNTPYFEFADWEERAMDDCGKREVVGFEPNSGKGTVARATLYFLLRYPGKIRSGAGRYSADRLPILLAWHLSEPPTAYELHRNAAIQELQGNRNPLIDFPKIATRIDFTKGLG
jgi:endonuclease I/V8-like Glu-specific endopeptidase/endonuclease/exonuclease/phosphatase family metal-dependent hydrolase